MGWWKKTPRGCYKLSFGTICRNNKWNRKRAKIPPQWGGCHEGGGGSYGLNKNSGTTNSRWI